MALKLVDIFGAKTINPTPIRVKHPGKASQYIAKCGRGWEPYAANYGMGVR